jgi:TRAP-type C4-dicarboxylate transport system substrate-binding protein
MTSLPFFESRSSLMKKLDVLPVRYRASHCRIGPDQMGSAHGLQRQQLPDPERAAVRCTEVDQLTGGKLKITLHPGGSLYKANEIKRAVQTAQVPAAEFILSGAANENPLFGIDSIPFLATSYAASKRSVPGRQAGAGQAARFAGHEGAVLRPLAGPVVVFTSSPVNAPADFAGTKMRAYNPATTRIAQLLKAQPVTIQLGRAGPGPGHGWGAELPDVQRQWGGKQAA